MNKPVILESSEDSSVNFVFKSNYRGFLEARYVRRSDDYFVAYLSSQTGCAQACRMCHLTATGQTDHEDASPADILAQAREVLRWYDEKCRPARIVHFNFMARGEPLESDVLIKKGDAILSRLAEEAYTRGLMPRYLISTIMPQKVRGMKLAYIFPTVHPDFYYSLYSMDESFRKRWLPRALPAHEALGMLKEYQNMTSKIPKLHWAFIENENDSAESMEAICAAVNAMGLRIDVNIVRYNPYSEKFGRESRESVIAANVKILTELLPHSHVQVIKRVGFDVKASCGMFVAPNETLKSWP